MRPLARPRAGFALEATILVVVLVGALIGMAVVWGSTVTRTGTIDYRGSRTSYAAEAGAEAVMAQLAAAIDDGLLTNAELDALSAPVLPGFTYEAMTVQRASGGPTVGPIASGTYAGLYAINQPIDIGITARDPVGSRASVVVSANAQSIPLFQFGVFYEGDLEILNGPPLTFAGWVHTNGKLYLSSANTYFESRITTPDSVWRRRKNNNESLTGVYINNDAGTRVQLNFQNSGITPATFRSNSETRFNSRLLTIAHSVSPLRLPLPDGVPPIAMVQRRYTTDDAATQAVKFSWKADWYIVVDLDQIASRAICHGSEGLSTPGGVHLSVRPPGKELPNPGKCQDIFKFNQQLFREGREDIGVDAIDLDIGELHSWVGSSTTKETRILYITTKGGSTPNGDYPVLRIVNGQELPNPLTIATDLPLYVHGNYNTVRWQPSALLGDAITFLSPSFNPSHYSATSTSYSKRAASNMSVYAAIAAGHSATPCRHGTSGCSNPPYGGGLENFPRFVETWTGKKMLYRGSLVSLFTSQHAARKNWQWRSYYDAPDRDWEFDLRFQDPDQLPPGTPTVGNVFQTAFRPVF